MKLLFVCTGNTCRSPMAEAIFNQAAGRMGIADRYSASSAGIDALGGEPPSRNAVLALREVFGIDIGGYRTKDIGRAICSDPGMIFTMTKAQKEILCGLYPSMAGRIHTLKEFTVSGGGNPNNDISDPYGMPLEFYEHCAAEIKSAVERLIRMLAGGEGAL